MDRNIARLADRLIVVSRTVGAPVYDFTFERHFDCSHPYAFRPGEPCVLRIGAIVDYTSEFEEKAGWGINLANSPADHRRASELEDWYPLISDLTPRTTIFNELPGADVVEAQFEWPVFIKGSRQTSKHNPELAIARDRVGYERLREAYRTDPILHWQKPVVREFVDLDPVSGYVPGKVRASCEFRSFWWHGELVGCGQYWYQLPAYRTADLGLGLEVAGEAARRVGVPFLVVDIARTRSGQWIVVECNDAQEAGYAGLAPQVLWQNILDRL
jgi:hypothetical protein